MPQMSSLVDARGAAGVSETSPLVEGREGTFDRITDRKAPELARAEEALSPAAQRIPVKSPT